MGTPFLIRAVFWLWLFGAILVGRFFILQRLPVQAIPAIIFSLAALLMLGYRRIESFRTWIDAIDIRALVLLHVTRFVGIYFLVLYRRGELPYAFAVPGGIGDIVVALLAILVVYLPLAPANRKRAITIWNVIGLVDILLVVFTAARIGLSGETVLLPLTYLPLSLLPTFLVPVIIASHVAIFARLKRNDAVES
jgi:hypothetical protein